MLNQLKKCGGEDWPMSADRQPEGKDDKLKSPRGKKYATVHNQ